MVCFRVPRQLGSALNRRYALGGCGLNYLDTDLSQEVQDGFTKYCHVQEARSGCLELEVNAAIR